MAKRKICQAMAVVLVSMMGGVLWTKIKAMLF